MTETKESALLVTLSTPEMKAQGISDDVLFVSFPSV